MDTSGSMTEEWMGRVREQSAISSADKIVSMIEQESKLYNVDNMISVVGFSDSAQILRQVTSNYSDVKNSLKMLEDIASGNTNIEDAIYKCLESLSSITDNNSKK